MMQTTRDTTSWQPIPVENAAIENFIAAHPGVSIVDETRSNLEELFLLRNPQYRFDKEYREPLKKFIDSFDNKNLANWFYFSWLNTLVRYLPEELHQELRTGRNKNLINKEEQDRFYHSTMAFFGMSVGSHGAIVSAMGGGSKHMKLVDPDVLSGDNLNRIRTGFSSVGLAKVIFVAREVSEINPYAEIELYPEGVTEKNVEKILSGVDLVVEETDNPYWKIKIRELARDRGISVIMGTDNGDGIIVDVERYDINRFTPILNGHARGITSQKMKTMPPKDLPRVAGKIAGANLVVPRMLESVAEVGKTLYSWPQLGTAANMCGSVIASLARRIINKNTNIASGRYAVNFDGIFESDYSRKWFSRKIAFFKFIRKMMSQ